MPFITVAAQDEDIEIEDEIDSDDPVVPEPGEASGTDLLEREYVMDFDGER